MWKQIATVLFFSLAACKKPIVSSSDSGVTGYTPSQLASSSVQAEALKVACAMEEVGWTNPNVPLTSQENIRTHEDLLQHFLCIANKESGFKPIQNFEGNPYYGIFQVGEFHRGDSISYKGTTYSCPNVSIDTLLENSKVNAQCALYVYVESYINNRGNALRPWEGKCNFSERAILPKSCGAKCDTLKTMSRVDGDKVIFTTVINDKCPASKITLLDVSNNPLNADGSLAIYSSSHTVKDNSVLISKQEDGVYSAKYFFFVEDLRRAGVKNFKALSYNNDTKYMSTVVDIPDLPQSSSKYSDNEAQSKGSTTINSDDAPLPTKVNL